LYRTIEEFQEYRTIEEFQECRTIEQFQEYRIIEQFQEYRIIEYPQVQNLDMNSGTATLMIKILPFSRAAREIAADCVCSDI
jgi:hypothetical protein